MPSRNECLATKSAIQICEEFASNWEEQARNGDSTGASDHRADAARQIIGELRNAKVAVPNGWKLVPAEPTDDMEIAAENDYEDTGATFPNWKSAYRAMLLATPPSPDAHTIGEDTANGAFDEFMESWSRTHAVSQARPSTRDAFENGYAMARAALTAEKVAGQVPVAWLFDGATAERTQIGNLHFEGPNAAQLEIAKKYGWKWIPLYTAPQQPAQPVAQTLALTDEQRSAVVTAIKAMTACGWTHRIPALAALLTAAQPASSLAEGDKQ